MTHHSRRGFLSDVGRGMISASIGSSLAMELGITTAVADEASQPLTFGAIEPLVDLMQQTPIEKLQPVLLDKIKDGTGIKTLVAAGALANAFMVFSFITLIFYSAVAVVTSWRGRPV